VRIDLHTHSTASDGTDTPTQLVERAVAEGLDVIAITDHDTTRGWAEAAAAAPTALTVVPGAEFSCVHQTGTGRRISMHVLGYWFDPDNEALRTERARLRTSRVDRARRIVELLEADDYPVTWSQVQKLARGGTIGRPHIGRALVDSGVTPSIDAAFRSVLSSRQPYYVPKADTPVLDAVRLIRDAGGLPVFAHPLARRRGPVVDIDVVAAMVGVGLVGLEVDHPDQDESDRAEAAGWAREFDLVPLGSSDYHGTNKTVRLAECTTSAAAFEQLQSRRHAAG
jgi:predicted metal-dependent phosphoesterase TrpH